MNVRRRGAIGILLVLLSVILVACAQQTEAPEPTNIPSPTEEPATEEPRTLVVWYLSQGPEEIQFMETQAQTFADAHPGVTVEFSAYGFDDMNTNLKLALDSGTGPDVAYASPGANGHVVYAQSGHLIDLTDAYRERGWDQHFDEDYVLAWQKQLDGAIYGIPFDVNVYGVFYNADLFNELGLEPPETWEELEQLLVDLKEVGTTPFATAGLDGWAFAHYWQNLIHATTPIDLIEGIMYNQEDVSYLDHPGFLEATEILDEWYENGYFNEGFLGLNYADENDLFVTGQTAMVLTGSWINAFYLENSDFEVGQFVLPQANPDIEWHGLINPNNVWIVSKYSQQQDLALEFLDYMLGEEVARGRWELGMLPGYQFGETPEPTSKLQADGYQSSQNVGGGYSFNANLPGSEAFIFNILQEMVIEDIPPAEVLEEINQNRSELLTDIGS